MALTLRTIRNTDIKIIIKSLYKKSISPKEELTLLKIAVLFLNNEVQEVKEFGYRILLKCCITTGNFIPLYDVAANLGYIPIMSLLQSTELLPERETFLHVFMQAYQENFKEDGIYQTENQHKLFNDFLDATDETLAVIAPTSYGKSQLIEKTIRRNPQKKIAIVVPSKALITQTRRRVVDALHPNDNRRVIIHHDSAFDVNKPFIAVVTQERILRLYQKYNDANFDIVFIDEAHNLLNGEKRARLLASSIIISQTRNANCAIKYLTPFLMSSDNLRTVTQNSLRKELRIYEKLKSEEYYVCDLKDSKKIKVYDQFLNVFFDTEEKLYNDEISLIKDRGREKNVIYLNKPKAIEQFSAVLAKKEAYVENVEIEKICKEIGEYVHPQYKVLDFIKRGIAYHHGSVPDIVRSYIEASFRKIDSIKWLTTNSTLLEGVNIPAETMFILDASKGRGNLSSSQFKNLIGRVNRFSEIFDPKKGSPTLLLPQIYLVNGQYSRSNANIEGYLKDVAKIDKVIKDEIKNPLLKNTLEDDSVKTIRERDFTYIENIEPNVELRKNPEIATTIVGRLCHIHNVYEIEIKENEVSLQEKIDYELKKKTKIASALDLMNLIERIFISSISDENYVNLLRLKNSEAKSFYAMFFDWRINQVNYGRMIASFVAYWKKFRENADDPIVFVGRWGNIAHKGFTENHINLTGLNDYELINLAIVRIKEEHDFIDNNLVKFLEILHDLEIVEESLYNKIKYGTDNQEQIYLIRNGLSHIAAATLFKKYKKYFKINSSGEAKIDPEIRKEFDKKKEQELISYEIETSGLIQEA